MSARQDALPTFGEADLSNCEREQIQFARSVQPHGGLLVVQESTGLVSQVSSNINTLLDIPSPALGRPLAAFSPELAACVDAHRNDSLDTIPVASRRTLGAGQVGFDVLMHRIEHDRLIIEVEPAGPPFEFPRELRPALESIAGSPTLRALCDETARVVKAFTGYDRVMVYRFDSDGHGEVYSEAKEAHLEAYLGNHYPASDIPQIARHLYRRNRVRVLSDVEYEPVLLEPMFCPIVEDDLDMSLCNLRSMSPIHLQYLKNMGVRATLVASLAVSGELWGLIACHHYVPRKIQYEQRVLCELLAETVSTRIAALESFSQNQAEVAVRRLEQRMIDTIARDGDWRTALFDGSDAAIQPLEADGAALLFEDQVLTSGDVPSTQDIRAIAGWLDQNHREPLFATASLGSLEPRFKPLSGPASGLLAAAISEQAGEYMLWFRAERVHTVTWGGNPDKPMVIGDDPKDLSPRRSFAQWHQQVEGTSREWSPSNLEAGRMIRESLSDVILQFRSVRMLILENQLEDEQGRIREAEHPAIVADAQGRILLANDAFQRLLARGHPHLQWVEDLVQLFTNSPEISISLQQLLHAWRPWRGEVTQKSVYPGPASWLLRADPVFESSNEVIGFVLIFTSLSARRAAEDARREFQESIYTNRWYRTDEPSRVGKAYRDLINLVVDNAQVTALEVTDSVNPERMPDMLDGVRTSVSRCTELLEHLASYGSKD